MLTFNCSPFHHFVEEDNGIWYPGRVIIKLLGYQIALTSCTQLQNDKRLKVSIWFVWDYVPYWKLIIYIIAIKTNPYLYSSRLFVQQLCDPIHVSHNDVWRMVGYEETEYYYYYEYAHIIHYNIGSPHLTAAVRLGLTSSSELSVDDSVSVSPVTKKRDIILPAQTCGS